MSSPWVSDDDVEEFDEHEDHQPRQTPEAVGSTGTPLPHMDPEVAAELAAEGPPEWLGVRWREIPAEQQWDAWNGLRRWVDWLVYEYKLTTAQVPPCWYRHTDITAELYAAMCMEYKVWEEQAPGLAPMMMWHPNLHQMLARLREMTQTAGCARADAHQEPTGYTNGLAPHELDYDEDDWHAHAATVRGTEVIDRPNTGVRYVRAKVTTGNGAEQAVSRAVGLRARTENDTPEIFLDYGSTAAGGTELNVTVTESHPETHVRWEESTDGHDWTELGTEQ